MADKIYIYSQTTSDSNFTKPIDDLIGTTITTADLGELNSISITLPEGADIKTLLDYELSKRGYQFLHEATVSIEGTHHWGRFTTANTPDIIETGAISAVSDESFTGVAITSVTDSGGIARFNFTPGPTLFVNQKVANAGYVTNPDYNGDVNITTTGAGFFEDATISFGSDEATGTFDSDSVEMTATANNLSTDAHIVVTDTTSYNANYQIYDEQTNTFRVNAVFVATETGNWTLGAVSLGDTGFNEDLNSPVYFDGVEFKPYTVLSENGLIEFGDGSTQNQAAVPERFSQRVETLNINSTSTVIAEDDFILDVAFWDDGTVYKMYVIGNENCSLYEYTIDGPGDIDSRVLVNTFVITEDPIPASVTITPAGDFIHVMGNSNNILIQYVLPDPGDTTTMTHDVSQSVASMDTAPFSHAWNPNGLQVFFVGRANNRVYGIDLTKTYDIGVTFVHDTANFKDISSETTLGIGLGFRSDGHYMDVGSNDFIFEYEMPRRWGIKDSVYKDKKFDLPLLLAHAGFHLDPSEERMYIVAATPDTIGTYDFGIAPNSVATGEIRATNIALSDGAVEFDDSSTQNQAAVPETFTNRVETLNKNKSVSVSGDDTFPTDVVYWDDGFKMYMLGTTDCSLYDFDLTEAYDPASRTLVNTFPITEDSNPVSLTITPNGKAIHVVGNFNGIFIQYGMTTAGDTTTMSHDISQPIASIDNQPFGHAWHPNGKQLFFVGRQNQRVYVVDLTKPRDISVTFTHDTSNFLDISGESSLPAGLDIRSDGVILYLGDSGDFLYEYVSPSPWAIKRYEFKKTYTLPTPKTHLGFTLLERSGELHIVAGADSTINLYDSGIAPNSVHTKQLTLKSDFTNVIDITPNSNSDDYDLELPKYGPAFNQVPSQTNTSELQWAYHGITSQQYGVTNLSSTSGGETAGDVYVRGSTGVSDTVSNENFEAGIPASDNPLVVTVGSGTFSSGMLVAFSDSPNNDGIYEVDTHSGTVLSPRGVGTTDTVEDFTLRDFNPNNLGADAVINQVNVTVLRTSDTGTLQVASGNTTPLVFQNVRENPADTVDIFTTDDLDALATAGEITVSGGETLTLNFKNPITHDVTFVLDGGFLLPRGRTYTYSGTGTLFSGTGVLTTGPNWPIAFSSTGTLFDIDSRGQVVAGITLQRGSIFGCNDLGTVAGGGYVADLPIVFWGAGLKLIDNRVIDIAKFPSAFGPASGILYNISNRLEPSQIVRISNTEADLSGTTNFVRIDPDIIEGSSVVLTGCDIIDGGGAFDTSGSLGTYTVNVTDPSIGATAITGVTFPLGHARFAIAGGTVHEFQEVINSTFTTNPQYNGAHIITDTDGAGTVWFEVDTITAGSDEAGSFLANSITLDETTTARSAGDTLCMQSDVTTEYDGGATAYNVLTNSFQVNRTFGTTGVTGSYNTGGITQTDPRVRSSLNTGIPDSKSLITTTVHDNTTTDNSTTSDTYGPINVSGGAINQHAEEGLKLTDEQALIYTVTSDEIKTYTLIANPWISKSGAAIADYRAALSIDGAVPVYASTTNYERLQASNVANKQVIDLTTPELTKGQTIQIMQAGVGHSTDNTYEDMTINIKG